MNVANGHFITRISARLCRNVAQRLNWCISPKKPPAALSATIRIGPRHRALCRVSGPMLAAFGYANGLARNHLADADATSAPRRPALLRTRIRRLMSIEDTFDVVVIGGGGAGLPACNRGPGTWALCGAALDKAKNLGGSNCLVDRIGYAKFDPTSVAQGPIRTVPRITGATWPASTAISPRAQCCAAPGTCPSPPCRNFPLAAEHGGPVLRPMP